MTLWLFVLRVLHRVCKIRDDKDWKLKKVIFVELGRESPPPPLFLVVVFVKLFG